jgi:hypothetical protein
MELYQSENFISHRMRVAMDHHTRNVWKKWEELSSPLANLRPTSKEHVKVTRWNFWQESSMTLP